MPPPRLRRVELHFNIMLTTTEYCVTAITFLEITAFQLSDVASTPRSGIMALTRRVARPRDFTSNALPYTPIRTVTSRCLDRIKAPALLTPSHYAASRHDRISDCFC